MIFFGIVIIWSLDNVFRFIMAQIYYNTVFQIVNLIIFSDPIKIVLFDEYTPLSKSELGTNLSFNNMINDDGDRYPEQIPDFNFFEDVTHLPFSSGTTGLPKGVMLTHANIIANITQLLYSKELECLEPASGKMKPN